MKRRIKRFNTKSEYANRIKIRINFHDGVTCLGSVTSLSLLSVGAQVDPSFEKYVDSSATASLLLDTKEFPLNKVFVLHSLPTEKTPSDTEDPRVWQQSNDTTSNKFITLIFRTLNANVPIEDLMRFLQNGGDQSPYDFELSHGKFTLADFYNYQGSDDILEKTNLFLAMHKSWSKKESYQFNRYRKPSKGKRVSLDRKRATGTSEYLIFGSNDYLGLATHPEVVAAAAEALTTYGLGSTGSPLTTGQTIEHINLQNYLAEIFQKGGALLYNSGYVANVGILSALCRKGDLVLYDKLSHASIADAIKMVEASGATCLIFKHNNMADLEKLLEENRNKYSGCLVITEGIFSMDGYIAKLDEIVALAKKYNARTYLDVAHDFGVIGENGLGAAEYHGVLDQVDVIMGTFSKIAGGIGGFCVSTAATIEYLKMMSRGYMFSVSLPPVVVSGVHQALRIFWEDKSLLNKLKDNIQYFVSELRRIGIELDRNHKSSICPVIITDDVKFNAITKILFDHGVYVTPIVFPAVSKNQSRFRFTITAVHDRTDLDYAILALEMAFEKVGLDVKNNQTIKIVA